MAEKKKNKSENIIVKTLKKPAIWNFLIKSTLGALLFIIAFNLSGTQFFYENPIFGVKFLAEFLIGIAFFAFGFHTLPLISIQLKEWFEKFLSDTVTKVVTDFWNQQTERMASAREERQKKKEDEEEEKRKKDFEEEFVLDTSVLVDGRILDIVKVGFMQGLFVVPQVVLDELHLISDSSNDLKRKRGRRGLDFLNKLKKEVKVRIYESDNDEDNKNNEGADKELVRIAKKYNMRLVTLDYNLNKVAKAKNVDVLNINELANALKTNVIPGEKLKIKIVQEGKEEEQGVGYLDDGTMVVVKGAKKKKGKTINVEVSKVIQTDAGKMIFCE